MSFAENYRRQVALLLRTIPFIAQEKCFALKGGTAINLFVRDLPRLSVDIDLTYLPVSGRKKSLGAIDKAMKRIEARIKKGDPGSSHHEGTHRKCDHEVGRTRGCWRPDHRRGHASSARLRVRERSARRVSTRRSGVRTLPKCRSSRSPIFTRERSLPRSTGSIRAICSM
jgi:hypothetical protein